MGKKIRSQQYYQEELANSVTHGIGMILSIAGAVFLIYKSRNLPEFSHWLSVIVFGLSLILLYSASTFYHSTHEPRKKKILRVVDHIAIYGLIAGTYTPFSMIVLKGALSWIATGLIWTMVFLGIVYKLKFIGKYPWISLIFYLLMSFGTVLPAEYFLNSLPLDALYWVLAGGGFYVFGIVFFLWRRLPYAHAIWHLFVIAGSICHYYAIYQYVVCPIAYCLAEGKAMDLA
ncbi:MAG: hemolysin III family protein [Cytophagales bacterium]|nr:hemolysin III family protein [Cytophagales bacterium]